MSPCRPSHRLAASASVDVRDLDGEPVFVVDRLDAPTAHDEIETYCTTHGARPLLGEPCRRPSRAGARHGRRRLRHRLAELLAGGAREDIRRDVAVKPLRPIALYDEFRVAWRVGDTAPSTSTFVRVVLETCGS